MSIGEVELNPSDNLWPESLPEPTFVVTARYPENINNPNQDAMRWVKEPDSIAEFLSDEAHNTGGNSPGMVEFFTEAGASEIASVVKRLADKNHTIVAQGARTSITGAVVPKGEVVLNFSRQKKLETYETEYGHFATVQPGVTIEELQNSLGRDGLFFPPAPTYDQASVIGSISTNASGARGYKYGSVRSFVEGLKVVLASGEVLEIERGQYVANAGDKESPAGYFLLQRESGEERRIPVPEYKMPDIPKISADYYARPDMDLIDLFIGSEGTLGVIAEATVRAQKEPPTYMAMVKCYSDDDCLELMYDLRSQEPEKRETLEPGGISVPLHI
ncbi:MAG: FAD-binding oxidoreductase [Candidatus Saccharimonadales bacterium]